MSTSDAAGRVAAAVVGVAVRVLRRALAAPSASAAAPLWAKAGEQVMKDAVIVPRTTRDVVLFAGAKVHNLIYNPLAQSYNVTQLWVSHQ